MRTWPTVTVLLIGAVAGAAAVVVWVGTSSRRRSHPGAALGTSGSTAAPAVPEARPTPAAEHTHSPTTPTESAGRAGPKVVVRQEDYDFGRMETDNARDREFVFANAGDQPLTVEQGKSFCGCCTCVCETQLPDGGKIAPGQSAAVTLRWTIKRFTGAFYQTSTILTNDPDRPEVTLGVSGRITPTVGVVPWQLAFSRVSAGQEATGEVCLYGYGSEPLRITNCRMSDPSSSQYFQTAIVPLPADQVAAEEDARSGLLLRVTLKSGLPLGPFRQQIVLSTNLDSAPTVEVPVEGTIADDISVVGPGWDGRRGLLEFPAVAGSDGAQMRLMLLVRGPHRKQVEFKPVRIVPECVEVDLGKTTATNNGALIQTPLTIRIPAGSPPGNYLGPPQGEVGQIIIDTNHPQQPQLQILVSFAVKD